MDKITTANNKDKSSIKPYRKYQLSILLCLLSFIILLILLYLNNNALNYVITQNDNIQAQLNDKMEDNKNFHFVLSRLEVNYVSLYQLDQTFTIEIVRTIREFHKLKEWMGKIDRKVQFYLCYKATKDGDNAKSFHDKCDGYGPIVMLFETVEGYRFGAYLSVSIMKRIGYVTDSEAFLFSYDTKKRYNILKSEVAFGDPENGFPFFGEGDIVVVDGFLNHRKSSCSFPKSYENKENNSGDYPLTGGLRNFRLKEMEAIVLLIEVPTDPE